MPQSLKNLSPLYGTLLRERLRRRLPH